MIVIYVFIVFPLNSLLLGFYLRKKELATLTGRAPELCGSGSVSRPCPLWLGSVAGLCVQALSSSCPLWLGSVSRPCPPLVLVLAVLLLSLSWPRP